MVINKPGVNIYYENILYNYGEYNAKLFNINTYGYYNSAQ